MSGTDGLSEAARPGGYRPEQSKEKRHPVFQWPPQPRAVIKWFFGFPGYLWPWQAFFIGLAFVTWQFLTPDMERMRHFSADWIALLFARNLVLLTVFVSVWHAWLYIRRAQGTEYKYNDNWLSVGDPAFLFRRQLWDNVFWNVCSAVPIWTAYEVLTLWLQANGFVPTVNWQERPGYFILLLLLTPMWADIHFYFIHRFIHWRPLYRSIHSLHHKNVNIGPWSGLAMHPVEHLLYFSGIMLFWLVPSHPLHGLRFLQAEALGAALAHLGFDRMVLDKKTTFNTDHYTHYLHHKHVQCNYSIDLLPLDRWFGTFHDGSDESSAALKERMRARALRSRNKARRA